MLNFQKIRARNARAMERIQCRRQQGVASDAPANCLTRSGAPI